MNLLVVLQVLLELQHVSRAALRLGMSQPAVSRALQRLRVTLDDPLLVRSGTRYALTPRAELIKGQLDKSLGELHQIIQPQQFIPEEADGLLKFTGLDLEMGLFIPAIVSQLRTAAPKLRVEVVPQFEDHFQLLRQGDVHFSFTGLEPDTGQDQFYRQPICRSPDICLMDRNNPLAKGDISLKQYAAAAHGLVSITGRGPGKMDRLLAEKGLQRKVMLRISSFMSVAEYCRNSDLIFTLPAQMANHLAQDPQLVVRPLPELIVTDEVEFFVYWHARFHHDPMCSWVRQQLAQIPMFDLTD